MVKSEFRTRGIFYERGKHYPSPWLI